jgi:DNA-binding MarR family transcriptional regulator
MNRRLRTPEGEAVTDLVLDLFRVSNRLVAAGDRLVAPLGLTSARWQILGAVAGAERPQPVAWLARDLGASRQNVQRIVNDLHGEGLVALEPNPRHRRAQLVVLTARGRQAFDAAMALQAPWIDGLAEGLAVEELAAARRLLAHLRARLEDGETPP